jgi:hypothetical protein
LILGFIAGHLVGVEKPHIVKFEHNEQQLGPVYEANPIKNWTSSEYVTYTDLNNNFNHLHANLGHGHGPIITANDISANAGIRPEQTTFGTGVANLVHLGNWKTNPDGGALYVPVNAKGPLSVSVSTTADGFSITGASSSDKLADGGSNVYDVFITPAYAPSTNRAVLCGNSTNDFLYATPLFIQFKCYDVDALDIPTAAVPGAIMIQIYSNKNG